MKPELLITVMPPGNPGLRGSCSACPNVTFAFVENSDKNRRLMQEAFDRHFKETHLREDS